MLREGLVVVFAAVALTGGFALGPSGPPRAPGRVAGAPPARRPGRLAAWCLGSGSWACGAKAEFLLALTAFAVTLALGLLRLLLAASATSSSTARRCCASSSSTTLTR